MFVNNILNFLKFEPLETTTLVNIAPSLIVSWLNNIGFKQFDTNYCPSSQVQN